jgi:hypothetical protein
MGTGTGNVSLGAFTGAGVFEATRVEGNGSALFPFEGLALCLWNIDFTLSKRLVGLLTTTGAGTGAGASTCVFSFTKAMVARLLAVVERGIPLREDLDGDLSREP